MIYTESNNQAVILVKGPDRYLFLQNLLTQDIASRVEGDFAWACLLNNKSKLIALLGLIVQKDAIALCLHQDLVAQVLQVLEMYTVIQEVFLAPQACKVFFVRSDNGLACQLDAPDELVSAQDFEVHRMMLGFPQYGQDYTDPIPLEVPFMHQAISFTKGCYVGQETIARLHARGMHVNRKLMSLHATTTFELGDEIFLDDEVVGHVTSVFQKKQQCIGLGWVKRKAFSQEVCVGSEKNSLSLQESLTDADV